MVGGGAGWAVHTILTPPPEVTQQAHYALVHAQLGKVSSSVQLRGAAYWELTPSGINYAGGIVTEVSLHGSTQVQACDEIYRVNESPVTIARGEIPAYRALSTGAQGRDVVQLQEMLQECGYFTGEVDGIYGSATSRAVRTWQKAQGITETGSVAHGAVMFTPLLPTQVLLDPDVVNVGAALDGGENVLSTVDQAPRFFTDANETQIQRLQVGMPATITAVAGTFEAVIKEISYSEETRNYTILYGPIAESAICGEVCAELPAEDITSFDVEISVVAPTEGIVIPLAALSMGADGHPVVVDADGQRIIVTSIAQAHGQAVVEGLAPGTKIRVPGDHDE